MTKFELALKFAVDAHEGQKRKLSGTPYILHPCEVAAIVSTYTHDEDVLCAAVLHDVVEDTSVPAEIIYEKFGKRVGDLVASETENKRKDLPPEATWRIRKEESLEHLKNTTDEAVKMLWLGDKLSNVRSIGREFLEVGDEVWNHFNCTDKEQQRWYYYTIADALRPSLSHTAAFMEYEAIIKVLFEGSKDYDGGKSVL